MNKTLEQLIEEKDYIFYQANPSEQGSAIMIQDVLALLKQVRLATIKECAIKATWSYNGPEEYLYSYADDITINRTELLNLDLNTIEL